MSEPELRDDDASLYVLGLLDEPERLAFEARLATQPALLDEVRALQANLESLALAAPPRTPPPHVWARIVERTARPERLAVPLFARLLAAFRAGWAVAGILALAWLGREIAGSWVKAPAPSAGDSSTLSRPGNQASRPVDGQQRIPRERKVGTVASGIAGDATPAPRGADEWELQKERVQMLSEQLATLSRALVERPILPPGSAELQLFRLVATNHFAEPLEGGIEVHDATSGEPSGQLQLALALAAAHQFAAQASAPPKSASEGGSSPSPSSSATQTANPNSPRPGSMVASRPTTPSDTSTPTDRSSLADAPVNIAATSPTTAETASPEPEPIQIVDLTSSTSTREPPPQSAASAADSNSGSTSALTMAGGAIAFGSYSVDTGFGAVAFRTLPNPVDGVYQLWVADEPQGMTHSIGFVQSKSPVVVMNFQTFLSPSIQPVFFITAEPAGGSPIPTGPVVALPPSATPTPAPNP